MRLEDVPRVGQLGEPQTGRVVGLRVMAHVGHDVKDAGHEGLLTGCSGGVTSNVTPFGRTRTAALAATKRIAAGHGVSDRRDVVSGTSTWRYVRRAPTPDIDVLQSQRLCPGVRSDVTQEAPDRTVVIRRADQPGDLTTDRT